MIETTDDGHKALLLDVERLFGRCVLRLQQVEQLLKATLQMCHLWAYADDVSGCLAVQKADVTRKTLGMLVGAFADGHLFGQGEGGPVDVPFKDAPDFSVRLHLEMTTEELDRTRQDLAELVALRNGLVHNFTEQHDLATVTGCQAALIALQAADERVEAHLLRLRQLATNLVTAQQEMVRALASGPLLEMLVKSNAGEGGSSDQGSEMNGDGSAGPGSKGSASARRH